MSGRDWQAFHAELRARVPELAVELLGKPTFRAGHEWRWGRKGSLSVIIAGPKAGFWFDHEAGTGGGFSDLVGRDLGIARTDATDWIADRIGIVERQRTSRRQPKSQVRPALVTRQSTAHEETDESPTTPQSAADAVAAGREGAAARSRRIWSSARPASADHPYLAAKHVTPLALRIDTRGRLLLPLQDINGRLHSLETISTAGEKRYLAGGAKRGHFAVVGTDPAPLPEPTGPLLICEGWATGASLHLATGLSVVAAMDASNLLPVAQALRTQFPEADLVLVADNDLKPDRDTNPGVEAARKAAIAVDARLAVPAPPGDANDLFGVEGPEAVAALVAAAARIPPLPPTYPAPHLSPDEARARLTEAIRSFMTAVPKYWTAVEDARAAAQEKDQHRNPLDFNDLAHAALPPILGLPVDVGLGKTSTARTAIADLLASGGLGARKVVYAVPRHDLGAEQVADFTSLGLRAMLWKGRTSPDQTPENPEQLMCLDTEATFDALEIEHPVEQSCCKADNGDKIHLCGHYHTCGYQRQKPIAKAADIIVCAHDSLFHVKPEAIGKVGLLVIDEAFWQSGLRGLDGKTTLTQDGLEPGRTSLVCYGKKGKMAVEATVDLVAARGRLWKALQVSEPGPLRVGLLQAVGLTAEECRHAAGLEYRRMRNAGLLPGMSSVERRARIDAVLPPKGEPWAPPGRCAKLWHILADALEYGHDAASAELVHEMTESGSVRALRLRWRSKMRAGWSDQLPILHLDATLRRELAQTYLPRIDIAAPVAACQAHVRIRQVTGSPTSARALTPGPDAKDRDCKAALVHLRDLRAWIALRARQCHRPGQSVDLLVIGQKAAIDALRAAGLPPRVEAVHFNALSGLDRWGGIGGIIVLGRTLPAPRTVEILSIALTGRVPASNPVAAGWWYPMVDRHVRLADRRTVPLAMEAHIDPIAEAVRWSICEGELIQAIGRGRGVNRTAATALEIDLLTDVVLPVTVDSLVPWSDLRPTRRDLMALRGIVLENAADMTACFPDLWPSAQAARQDRARSVTNCYYRSSYNSKMSHSSVEVAYRPAGPGHRERSACVDLARIPDPEAWLTNRLGPLAYFELRHEARVTLDGQTLSSIEDLDVLGSRLTAGLQAFLGARRAALDKLAARLEAARPPHGP